MAEPITYTESFTMDGAATFVRVANILVFAPISFKVNGVETELKQTFVDPGDGSSWFWDQNTPFIELDSVTAPVLGTVIVVVYQLADSNYSQVSSPDSISDMQGVNDPSGIVDPAIDSSWDYIPPTPSGIYQGVVDIPGLTSADGVAAVAAGMQRKTSVIPLSVQFTSLVPGLEIGHNLSIEWPQYGLTGTFVITEVSRKARPVNLGHGSVFERSVTAVILQDAPEQEPEDPVGATVGTSTRYPIYPTAPAVAIAQRTAIQPPATQQEKFSVVLGDGADIVAGMPLGNPYPVQNTGTLYRFTIIAGTPPVNQTLVVDVFADGVSLFGTTKLEVASGVANILETTRFHGYPTPLRILKNQVLTFSAAYRTGSGTRTAAQNVTVIGMWAF